MNIADRLNERIAARAQRRQRIASLFDRERPGPPDGVERRQQPRLTLEELEEIAGPDLEKILTEKTDDRSGFTKFFDVLDLPRNVVANVLLRGAVDRKKLAAGEFERGTFGLPKITFSDVLDEAGVDPGFARSAAGFVGDVALDPLTYLGGTSAVKIGGKGGAIGLKKGASKALTKATQRIAAGETVSAAGRLKDLDPVLDLLHRARASLAKQGRSNEEIASKLTDFVRGRVSRPGIEGATARARHVPGLLARKVGQDDDLGVAITRFLQREAKSGKMFGGLTVGVPFTTLERTVLPFDPAIKQLRRFDVDDLARQGQSRLEKLHAARTHMAKDVKREAELTETLEGLRSQQARETARVQREVEQIVGERDAAIDEIIGGVEPKLRRLEALANDPAAFPGEVENARRFISAIREVIDAARRGEPINLDAINAGAKSFAEQVANAQDVFGPRIAEAHARVAEAGQRYTQRIDEVQQLIDNVGEVISPLHDEIAALRMPRQDPMLIIASKLHSSAGLDWDSGIFTLGKLSRMVRNTAPVIGDPIAKRIADTLVTLDRNLQRFVRTGIRGSTLGTLTREFQNTADSWLRRAQSTQRELDSRIRNFASTFAPDSGITHDNIVEAITAKLEVGMAAQKSPDGRFAYAGILSDSQEITPDLIAEARRQAAELAEANGLPEPIWDELFDVVEGSMRSGLWDNAEINAIVDEIRPIYQTLEESALRAGILDAGIPNFAARVPTTQAAHALRRQAGASPLRYGDPIEANILATQGFQRHRTTNRFVWTDANGEIFDLYGFELDSLARRAAEGDEAAQRVIKKLNDAKDAGLVPEHGFQTSVFHANRMAEADRFQTILGGDFKGKMFDVDPSAGLAANMVQIQRAKLGRDFARFSREFANAIDQRSLQELVNAKALERVGGELGASISGKGDAYRVLDPSALPGDYSRGEIVRYLNDIGGENPLNRQLGGQLDRLLFDDRVANAIEDYASVWSDPARIEKFLSLLDRPHQYLKTVTLMHPSWSMLNIVGNMMGSFIAGVGPEHLPLYKTSFDLHSQFRRFVRKGLTNTPDFDRWLNGTIEVGGIAHRRGDLIDAMNTAGVWEQGRMVRQFSNAVANGIFAPTPSVHDKILGNRAVRAWWNVNHNIEQVQRGFTFMGRVALGDSLDEAARTAVMHHYDYGDFTKFEKSFMRRLVLFYPWVRNNTSFMVRKTLEDPKWAASFPKLKTAFDSAWDEEARIPDKFRPKWFVDQLGVQIGHNQGLLLPLLTPIQDVAEIGQTLTGAGQGGIRDFLHYATSTVSPILQTPFELAAGREFFTGREIGDPDLGGISPGEFILNQARPVREFHRFGALVDRGDLSVGEKVERAASRALLAGRVQFIDPGRVQNQRIFDLYERAAQLRQQANIARRDGDTKRLERLAGRLFSTYAEMLRIDPETDRVPKAIKDRILAPTQAGS